MPINKEALKSFQSFKKLSVLFYLEIESSTIGGDSPIRDRPLYISMAVVSFLTNGEVN